MQPQISDRLDRKSGAGFGDTWTSATHTTFPWGLGSSLTIGPHLSLHARPHAYSSVLILWGNWPGCVLCPHFLLHLPHNYQNMQQKWQNSVSQCVQKVVFKPSINRGSRPNKSFSKSLSKAWTSTQGRSLTPTVSPPTADRAMIKLQRVVSPSIVTSSSQASSKIRGPLWALWIMWMNSSLQRGNRELFDNQILLNIFSELSNLSIKHILRFVLSILNKHSFKNIFT